MSVREGLFRRVELPSGVQGCLFLHSMPGRGQEPLQRVWQEVREEGVGCIVSLASLSEIQEKSPEYARAIEAKDVPCQWIEFPIPDYGIPEDREAFYNLARDLAARLQRGERVLIHCGAGIGRTGMLAICVLMALGEPLECARRAVDGAGSSPETSEQWESIAWFAKQAGPGR